MNLFNAQASARGSRCRRATRGSVLAFTTGLVLLVAVLASPGQASASSGRCADPLGCVFVAPGRPVEIATLLALSGGASQLGIDSQHGTDLAVALGSGSVLGHPIKLTHFDGGCDVALGTSNAQRILRGPQFVATIGPTCSSVAVAVAPLFSQHGMVLISPSDSAPSLTDPATHQPTFLRTAYNDVGHAAAMADFVTKKLGLTTAAVISDGFPVTLPFGDAFTADGGTVVADEQVPPGTTDFTSALQAAAAARPAFLFFAVADAADLVLQARATAGLASTALGTWTEIVLTHSDFLARAGAAADGVYAVTPDFGFYDNPPFLFPNPDYQAVVLPAYQARWGNPPYAFHAHAYDATNLILAAVAKVAVQSHGSLLIGRRALLDALYATTGYPGLIGNVTCHANGDCNPGVFAVSQVQAGQWVRVSP